MSSGLNPEGVPPGAPVVPQGPVPAVGVPNSQDYPRLVYTAPRFEVVAIADIIEPSVLEACEALLPTLVPPYVNQAAIDAVNATAVRRAGDTMTGPLNLSPVIPTANAMAASKQYVDTMIATGAVPEVPPVPAGQAWARETGQWVPIAGGGTVTNIATGAGLTGGPITATGIISMANMAANSLKGNATGAVAAPTDIPAGTVLTMIGGAPLNSPNFTGTPTLPTGTTGVTQSGGTSNTTLATTAFVANTVANYAPLVSPVFTGAPSLPTGTIAVTQTAGTSNTSVATTAFVGTALGSYLPLTGGTLSGPGNLTARGGLLIGAAGAVPAAGNLTLNANTVAPPATTLTGIQQWNVSANNTNSILLIDTFGSTGANALPLVQFRHARGTAAAQSAVQSGDFLGIVECQGYAATAYGNTGSAGINISATENWTATANGAQISFVTTPNGATTPAESLRLQGNTATFSGNVNLGQSTGSSWAVTVEALANAAVILQAFHNWQVISDPGGTYIVYDQTAGANRLTISAAGACAASSAWAVISDIEAKSDVTDHPHGLAEILQLQPKVFRYSEDDRPGSGLIAQELEAVMPELVGEMATADGGTVKTVTETGILWPLINAIKELKAEIDALKTGRPA